MARFFVYIVQCERDNSFYTGYTKDLVKRIELHNNGRGSKYTRARGPVTLLYHEEYKTRWAAMRREREIKKLSRKKKKELIHFSEAS